MSIPTKVVALIPAAGSGSRLYSSLGQPKQFVTLGGKSILAYTLTTFQECNVIDEIIIVTRPSDIQMVWDNIIKVHDFNKVVDVIEGGETRQESVWCGLRILKNQDVGVVVVHDAARIFVTTDIINESVTAAINSGAGVVCVPVGDTIKLGHKGFIHATLDRSVLWHAQTPQSFQFSLIFEAHENAQKSGFIGTDEAMLVERLGKRIHIVKGSKKNIKITAPDDIELARLLIASKKQREN